MREHEIEPVWGLPEQLPEGERILWQGRPAWRAFARRGLHLPLLAGYFAVMLASHAGLALLDGVPAGLALYNTLWFLPFVLLALGVITGIGWLIGRTTAYTITNRRLVMRLGVALPITANLPFRSVNGAAVTVSPDGTGDISLSLIATQKVSYLFFWPHVRPWQFGRAQPSLRSIPDAAAVAQILSRALAAEAAMPVQPIEATARPAADDARQHAATA